MKTREELLAEARVICDKTHELGDGCLLLQCVKCGDGWNILECSNDALWKKYEKGCITCGGEYELKMGHCEL